MASVELNVEAETVQIATLSREQIPVALHTLLRLIFFTERAERFFSLTVTEADVTIIATAEDLSLLSPYGLQQDGTNWRVVRVGEGAQGFEEVGVIERITGPLAAAEIPVLYISTFCSDYVLIPSARLDDALLCFDPSAAREPSKQPAPHSSAAPPASPPADSPADSPADAPADAPAGSPPDASVRSASQDPPQHSHPLNVLHACTRILQIERRHRQAHTHALIRLLFMPAQDDPPQLIASLTETPDEISILAGDSEWWNEHCKATEGVHDDSQLWVPLRVGDACGTPLEEIGVVATQAYVLSMASVTILYLSTYFSDYTLVMQDSVETAVSAFKRHGFNVTHHGIHEIKYNDDPDESAHEAANPIGQPNDSPALQE